VRSALTKVKGVKSADVVIGKATVKVEKERLKPTT
jgi:copper chaperone CopZ